MKKFFIILSVLIVVTVMGGCLNLASIFPILNVAPIIISEPIITATEDQLYLYQVEASDPNGDTLTYSSIIKPEEMNINSENGLIIWTPTNDQVGINLVVVEISDGKHSVTQSFEIEVINVNNSPQILSYSPTNIDIKINEGDSVKFEIQAQDIDLNTTLSYQWLLNGKKVSSSTGSGNDSKSSWIYSASYGDYSQKIVKILISDGELEDYIQWNITINDITPPTQPTLDALTSPTNISPQILSGTKETNSSILINGSEVIPINSETTWSYSYNLSEGENNISIISKDTVGNESNEIYATIILDISAPTIPGLDTITSPTNISPQILSGTKEINTSIWINGAEVISINSDTTWSYSYNLSEGENNISITSQDSAGNESDEATVKIILDTISPATPTIHNIISPTNIYTQLLSGNKEINSSILVNGVEVISVNSVTTWSYSFNLSEGENNISIISKDTVGNESNEIYATIILDISAPTIPGLDTITSPTNISPQILSGTKETNSSILINGAEVISLNSSTNWSYSYNLSEGTNDISVTSRDAAGNESLSITTNIILDTSAPAATTLDAVLSPTNVSPQTLSGTKESNTSIWINGAEVISLNSSTNWSYSFNLSEGTNDISITSRDTAGNKSSSVSTTIVLDISTPEIPTLNAITSPTNISPQILSGTKETNASVWINNIEIIPINPITTWSYSYNLSEGENNISIISKDTVGNESNEIYATIILDTIAPTIPGLDTLTSPTNISPQILSGTKEINTSIWINGAEVISLNSSTNWSYSFNLSEGTNDISVTSRDAAGNESSAVTAIIILDTINPAAPTLDAVLSPTNVSPQTLSGTKESNTSIWINGAEVISINSETTWSYSYNLSEGANNISIASRDAAGNESSVVLTTIEYDLNIYVDIGNTSGIEDGTQTHPFNSITEGIEAATPGKSVVVAAGTYCEQLIINKGITLQGAGKESTIISGLGYTGNLITVTADDVTISGFTIDGKSGTDVGIYSDSSSSIEISENLIQIHRDSGILYQRASDDYPSGIYVYNNEICQNSINGIKVTGAGSGIIEGNIIRNNDCGIKASNDASIEVKKNNIYNNYDSGIFCRNNSSLLIWGNEITSNGYGIRVGEQYSDTTNPDIGGGARGGIGKNNIFSNATTLHGVSNMTSHNISAKYNWWGDAAGPKYPNNPDGNANLLSDWAYWDDANNKAGAIKFDPYLEEPQTF